MGVVDGSNESYSFWKDGVIIENTTLYGMNGTCMNCVDSVTLFSKDDTYNVFYTDEQHIRVDKLLNRVSYGSGYGMYWSKGLTLTHNLIVNVSIGDVHVGDYEVIYGTAVGNIEGLKEYMNDEYILIDSIQRNVVYQWASIIGSDSDILIEKMKSADEDDSAVVIELETPTTPDELNKTEVISIVCELIGVDAITIFVEFETDEYGNITGVVVYVGNESTAEALVDILKSPDSTCYSDVLCRNKNTYNRVSVSEVSLNTASFRTVLLVYCIVLSNIFFYSQI